MSGWRSLRSGFSVVEVVAEYRILSQVTQRGFFLVLVAAEATETVRKSVVQGVCVNV